MSNVDQFLWVEKYRPQTINDCILPQSLKDIFNGFIAQTQIPHMLFSGSAGTGKTTVGHALARELDADLLFINCSLNTGIDIIRNQIVQFASTASLGGNLKIVLLDEIERMSSAAQDSLKSTIEIFSQNTRFILTSNNKNKIIDPIISRCTTIEFKIEKSEQPKLAAQLFKRLKVILGENNVEFDPKVLQSLIMKFYPDNRKIINELQRYSANGSCVDVGVLSSLSNTSIDELISYLKDKDFTKTRKWIANNNTEESTSLFRAIYDKCLTELQPQSVPEMVLILSKYSYQSCLCIDQELNNIAACVELMSSLNFI